ncbi:cobyrinate a,c-diamide synthase [Carboxylicivirga linearis]|uniref:Cobyrinate a,c-diamide synthase n=1 Tax=Carboxylicivirga linearis TaxID=1628157 RepID=A0ABS5JSP1_9BACT|nr:cobyrinate a,c-diamide synthase [Carboxylicivirga linearis]MBS2097406.1 cobyrinate a,c-diamide synthase [Carboxylicivirga linearis]
MYGFVIAGTNSGCGKTTISIGLMALMKSLGKGIAPFKTGPDYIDPIFHSNVLGTSSYNLDSYLLSESAINYLFQKHCFEKDVAIVEGVMGMYDGMGVNAIGSTHQLSVILNLPVVLVINCKGLYQSVAAIVKGFTTLQPNARVKGVIFNHCSGKDYYQFLKEIVERECNVKCVGYLPANKDFELESRHLGLVQAEEVDHLSDKIEKLTNTLKETIDVDGLMEISKIEDGAPSTYKFPVINLDGLVIGVASDKAFRFYYQDNIELLKELGAKLHYFSPLKDESIPDECNCLYIGGGYPEVFAKELSENKVLLEDIKVKIDKGMPAYAECGGLMYLTDKIMGVDDVIFPMVGVFNSSVQMTKKLQRFGYAELSYSGEITPCHEFHHSKIIEDESSNNYELNYQLKKPDRDLEWKCGLKYKNCLAGYAHIHFYSNPKFFEKIIDLWKSNN